MIGRCGQCRRWWYHWWRRRPIQHSTDYGLGRGVFALCERCWSEMTPEERLPFYRSLWEDWIRTSTTDSHTDELLDRWPAIERAVLEGR